MVGLGFLSSVEGRELAAGLRDDDDAAGALWMALTWFPRVLFSPLSSARRLTGRRLDLDAVVVRQSPPLGTMWKLAVYDGMGASFFMPICAII